jgi:hypothetical protein
MIDLRQTLTDNASDAESRLEQLTEFAKTVDSFFKEEAERFSTELKGVDDELGWFFAQPFPTILHSSITVSVVMLLEQELRGIAQALHSSLKLQLGLRDISGTVVYRFRKYILGVARLSLRLGDDAWQDVNGIVELRNCIVHANGYLPDFNVRSCIEQLSGRHPEIKISDDSVALSRDSSVVIVGLIRVFLASIYDDLRAQS